MTKKRTVTRQMTVKPPSFLKRVFSSLSEETVIELMKRLSFAVLPFVLVYVSVTFFIKSSDTLESTLKTGVLNAIPEFVCLWILLFIAKMFEVKSHLIRKGFAAVALLLVYLFLSSQSYVARIGTVIVEVETKTAKVETVNSAYDQNSKEIQALDMKLDALNYKLSHVNQYSTNSSVVEARRDYLVSQILLKTAARGKLVGSNSAGRKVDDVMFAYTAIADRIHVSPIGLFTFTTTARMFGLDICAVLVIFLRKRNKKSDLPATGPISIKETKSVTVVQTERDSLLRYIKVLMENEKESDNRLRSDRVIAKKTGISLGKCQKYRELLINDLSIGKTPIITPMSGKSVANFYHRDVQALLESY